MLGGEGPSRQAFTTSCLWQVTRVAWPSREGVCEEVVVAEAMCMKGLDCQPGDPALRDQEGRPWRVLEWVTNVLKAAF